MEVIFFTSAEFYKDNQTLILSDDGFATGPDMMKWFSPFIWKNTLYVVDNDASIYRLNNQSKPELTFFSRPGK